MLPAGQAPRLSRHIPDLAVALIDVAPHDLTVRVEALPKLSSSVDARPLLLLGGPCLQSSWPGCPAIGLLTELRRIVFEILQDHKGFPRRRHRGGLIRRLTCRLTRALRICHISASCVDPGSQRGPVWPLSGQSWRLGPGLGADLRASLTRFAPRGGQIALLPPALMRIVDARRLPETKIRH